MLDLFQRVRVGQAAIQSVRQRLLPDARGFAPILRFDLRRRVLEDAQEIDPALAVQDEDFIEVGHVKLPPFIADDEGAQRALCVDD